MAVTVEPPKMPIELDLRERTLALYEKGLMRGDPTGWLTVDKLFSVATKQWTLITGFPGSGKSEWLDALLVNLAESSDWGFAFYSPENHPTETHLAKLIEKHLRKPFGAGPTERVSREELDDAIHWVESRFLWLLPQYKSYTHLFASAQPFRRLMPKKFGLVLDPWNTLEHQRPKDMTETEYISMALTDVTNWCRKQDMHIFIVAHPAKMMRGDDGKRPVPTPYDVAGSANWYNKADNIICVHRDQMAATQDVKIFLQKVRFKHIGKIGEADLQYERLTGRYHDSLHVGRSTVTDF